MPSPPHPGRTSETFPAGARLLAGLRKRAAETGMRLFDLGQDGNGIVHVMGPELGIVLPGTTLVCGDSHTCTNGGVGALAFGIGASRTDACAGDADPAAAQAAHHAHPLRGHAAAGRHAEGHDPARHRPLRRRRRHGYAVEYAGSAVRALSLEGRLTLCNLSIEMGAKMGMVAPDETTFDGCGPRLRAERRILGCGAWRIGARCRAMPGRVSTATC